MNNDSEALFLMIVEFVINLIIYFPVIKHLDGF